MWLCISIQCVTTWLSRRIKTYVVQSETESNAPYNLLKCTLTWGCLSLVSYFVILVRFCTFTDANITVVNSDFIYSMKFIKQFLHNVIFCIVQTLIHYLWEGWRGHHVNSFTLFCPDTNCVTVITGWFRSDFSLLEETCTYIKVRLYCWLWHVKKRV